LDGYSRISNTFWAAFLDSLTLGPKKPADPAAIEAKAVAKMHMNT